MRVERADSNGDRIIPAVATGPEPPLLVDEQGRLITSSVAEVDASGATFSATPPITADARAMTWHSATEECDETPTAIHTLLGVSDFNVVKLSIVNDEESDGDLYVGPSDGNAQFPPLSPGTGIDIEVPAGMRFAVSQWLLSTDAGSTATFKLFYLS